MSEQITVEQKQADIRIAALLLSRKMSELEKEDAIYMWDEVITYLRQSELGKNRMEYEKLL